MQTSTLAAVIISLLYAFEVPLVGQPLSENGLWPDLSPPDNSPGVNDQITDIQPQSKKTLNEVVTSDNSSLQNVTY